MSVVETTQRELTPLESDCKPEAKLDQKENKLLWKDDARVSGILVKIPKKRLKTLKRWIKEVLRNAKLSPKKRKGAKGVIQDSEESEYEEPSGVPKNCKYSFNYD